MSELIDNSRQRKDLLKHMILQLHEGIAPEQVRGQLVRLIGQIPYGEVVQVEQELIAEGLPQEEVLRLCDVHTAALQGQIDLSGVKPSPPGHPVHTFMQENRALESLAKEADGSFAQLGGLSATADPESILAKLRPVFNQVWEVDKHYRRKENLLFPLLEKRGITGPPTVMWGKHDQARALLRGAMEALKVAKAVTADEASALVDLAFGPAIEAITGMILKEERILFPMCLDVITDSEWYDIYQQSPEIGFCLYDPRDKWRPENLVIQDPLAMFAGRIVLPTGSFDIGELTAMLNTLPVDLTFVDKDDTVRFFTQGRERIFDRNRTILGRKVQLCHPPTSVHIVNQIVDDFRSRKQDRAEFWINLHGQFVYISYYAVRNEEGEYLGTIEVTMDLTRLRQLEGERRLLSYESAGDTAHA